MKKERNPLSTKKPPVPLENHNAIEEWMTTNVMPGVQPIVKKIDNLIEESIPNLQYSIKWGNAYYGSETYGWLIEVAAYSVSVNIVFLNGIELNSPFLLGDGKDSRYVKIKTLDDLNNPEIKKLIKNASSVYGWKYYN